MIPRDITQYIDLYGQDAVLHILEQAYIAETDEWKYEVLTTPQQMNEDWDLPCSDVVPLHECPVPERPPLHHDFDECLELLVDEELASALSATEEAITLLLQLLPVDRTFPDTELEAPITREQALRQWNRIKRGVPILVENGEGWIDAYSALEVAEAYHDAMKDHMRTWFIQNRTRCCAILRREMTKARKKDEAKRFEQIRRLTTVLRKTLAADQEWPTWAGGGSGTVTDPRIKRRPPSITVRRVNDELDYRYKVLHQWTMHKEQMLATKDVECRDPENMSVATDVAVVECFPFYRFFPRPSERTVEPKDMQKTVKRSPLIKWPEGHPKRVKSDREAARRRRRRAEQRERERQDLPEGQPVTAEMVYSPIYPITVPEAFVPWVKELDDDKA